MSIKYINGINERLTRYLTRTIYLNNRGDVTMMGKYDINGQLEMLLCWRKPIKAVAWVSLHGDGNIIRFTKSCTHMHYVEGVYYNNISMAQSKTTATVGAVPTGDAPTTYEWSKIVLPTKPCLILEVWQYLKFKHLHSRKSIWKFRSHCVEFSSLSTSLQTVEHSYQACLLR